MRSAVLSLFPALAAAHFQLTWPVVRGFDEDKLVNYPCGGQDTPSSNRTTFPLSGAPIQLDMGHTQANVQVILALGNNPTGADFVYTMVPTFAEQGPQNFCIGTANVPANANVTSGMNGTILVITNGDSGSGGLYNCADVTFTSTPLSTAEHDAHCTNSTGIKTSAVANGVVNANGTGGTSTSSSASASSSASGSATATGASASSTKNAAPMATAAGWLVAGMGVAAGVLAL